MEPDPLLRIIILILLLAGSAFFSSAETAFTCVNKIQLQLLADEGDKRAARALKILDNTPKMLSAVLIGNNIVNIAASALTTTLTIQLFGNAYVGIAAGVLTFIILIAGEVTPKSIAVIKAQKLCCAYSGVIYAVMIILTPVIFIVELIRNGLMRILGVRPDEKPSGMTEDELKELVDAGYEAGAIENDEFQMINNIFSLDDSDAKDIMVPLADMTFVHIDTSYEELMEIFREDNYTRYPVYSENTSSVIGTINMKDIFMLEDPSGFTIRKILREPHFTFEHKEVGNLLIEMREKSINIIIVLDEYGATSGMITLEDILEEIVGEIRDEYDKDETDAITELKHDGEYLIDGATNLMDINDKLGTNLTSDEYDTLGGYILEHLDRLPKKGEKIIFEDGMVIIPQIISHNRIVKVKLRLPHTE